jgi:hypothetical protein
MYFNIKNILKNNYNYIFKSPDIVLGFGLLKENALGFFLFLHKSWTRAYARGPTFICLKNDPINASALAREGL